MYWEEGSLKQYIVYRKWGSIFAKPVLFAVRDTLCAVQ